MKKFLFLLALIILSSFYVMMGLKVQAGDAEASVQTYFEYLKDGDTEGILNILTDPLLSERRKLLEDNPEYPEFLKNTYQGANLEIKSTENIDKNKKAVDVEIHYVDGSPLKARFLLKMVDNSWKIAEEINNP
jgi:hypothetical protein